MKRILCVALAVVLAAGFCACGAGVAAEEQPTLEGLGIPMITAQTRPIPDEGSAEIEKNKELLMSALPIDDATALRFAEALYCYCVPELAEVKDVSYDQYKRCTIRVVGKDNVTYGLVTINHEAPFALYKEGERGNELLSPY